MPLTRILLAVIAATTLAVPAAWAQIVVKPSVIEVSVVQDQTATLPLTLSNTTAEPVRVALSLAPSPDDLPDDGTAPGDVLFVSADYPSLNSVAGLPDGRVVITASRRDFAELTAGLDYLRTFEHPNSEFLAGTVGVTYNADARSPLSATPGEGTLWWLDQQTDNGEAEAAAQTD